MKTAAAVPKDVDAYIAGFPPEVRKVLEKVRRTIRRAAPDAEESVSYGIAAYKLNGVLIYFAGHRAHLGLYPRTASMTKAFGKELAPYEEGKGTLRFPLDEPVPHDLIERIVRFRAEENRAKPRKR
jgi:uncharacterized protein YdhG (YjbR/CyaY superfamily)